MSSDIKKQLREEYKFRTELHAHTSPASPCSQISPAEMAKMYGDLGYDALVITNHFAKDLFGERSKKEAIDVYLADYEATKREAQKYGFTVILGTEVRFAQNSNDYLLYGVDRDILDTLYDYLEKGVEVYRSEVELKGSVFVQAHPFRDHMTMIDPNLLDGVEVFNMHLGHNSRISLAARHAKENNLKVITGGSDLHYLGGRHEGQLALRTKVPLKDSFDVAKILKDGDYLFEMGRCIILP